MSRVIVELPRPLTDLAERRASNRHPIYISSSIHVDITTHEGVAHGLLFDIGIKGLGIAVPHADQWQYFSSAQDVELQIEARPGHKSWILRGVVKHLRLVETSNGKYMHVGVELAGSASTELSRKRLSGFHSHRCPELFRPIAYCADPIFFGETLHFQVAEVRPSGLLAYTSLRNKSLFPGAVLDLAIMVPNSGEFHVSVEVIEVKKVNEDKFIHVEMVFEKEHPTLLAALGEFILTFQKDLSIATLRKQGFFLDTIYKAIRMSYPSGKEDWQAVLNLRLKAYQSVGKFIDRTDSSEMADPFDAFARQIVARVGGKIVGAARVVFVGQDLMRSEHHALGIPIPEKITKAGFVEFSRFCSDTEFRGADIFIALMRQAGLISTESGFPYVVANCNSDLWKIYKELGFRRMSPDFEAFGKKDCRLIAADIEATIFRGKRGGFFLWNQTLRPIQEFAADLKNRPKWQKYLPWMLLQKLCTPIIEQLRMRKNFRQYRKQRRTRRGR